MAPSTPATLRTIEVTPAASQAAAGTVAQFKATGLYTDNSTQDLTGQVSWASSDAAVATVSNAAGSRGVVTMTGIGGATVSATSGGVTGSTTLTVTAAVLVSIEVTPPETLVANGLQRQFVATGVFSDNSTQDITTQVAWASSNAAVATVSDIAGSMGLATAIGVGATTIAAAAGGVTGSTTMTVTPATLSGIEVAPVAARITIGSTQQFAATGVFSDNSTQDLTTQVIWTSSDAAVATVSAMAGSNGVATAASVGGSTISASLEGVAGSATLTVTPAELISIEVAPAAAGIAKGLTQQFTATGVFSDNSTQDLTSQVTWASSDNTVATVSNAAGSNGLVTTIGVGSTTVSAMRGAITGGTGLTVTSAELVSIEVTPAAASIASGLAQPFTATGVYSDNSTLDLTTEVTWASSDHAVATVSNAAGANGIATAAGVGNATVSATSGSVAGDASLTVTSASLLSIEVSPAAASVANGSTQQFAATGLYTDGSTTDLTGQVTWSSSDGAVATVSNAAGSSGLATTTGLGSITVSATSGDASGDATLTVTAATLVAIDVSPMDASVANGLTQQLSATGVFSDNSTQDLTAQVTWASSDGAVATVSNATGTNGLATAAGVGSTTVSATSGAVSGSTTLTVTAATLVAIDVTPPNASVSNGLTQQFSATGVFSDNSTQDLTTQVTWSSSDGAVATVSNATGSNGLATAASVGSTTVSATSGGVSGSTTLTVTQASLSADQQISTLLAAVVNAGVGASFVNKLTTAQDYLAVPDIVSACAMMDDFDNQVLAQRGKKITAELADQWLADADAIKTAIPCP